MPNSFTETPLRLRLALEASGEIIFMTDARGVISYVNPEFVRVYGYAADEVVGVHTPRILKGGGTTPDEYAAFWDRLRNQEVVRHEFVNRTKSGEMVCVESSANPIVAADGTCIGFLAVQRDVTSRRAMETALRESEARYRTLADAAHDSIYIVNRESEIVYANTVSLERFGKRIDEALGRKLHDVFPAATAETMWGELLQVFDSGERHRFETRFETPHGELWLESWVVPMLDRHAVMGVSRDISGRKRLERQFAQAQKMEAVGRLAGGIAHDFNNLLTAIMGYSELVLAQVPQDASIAEDVEEIRKAGERASRLTRQLLAFSRQQVLEPRSLDLNALVRDLHNMLDRLIGEDVHIEVTTEPDLECVKADPGQIEQLILNLVVNARDAMPQGGRLRVTTSTVVLDEQCAREHEGAAPGRYVAVAVADTGCGMSSEVLAHVFEPFFTTKGPGKGTGLGLATVFGVVKQSGGFLTVDSMPGAGTTITAHLPVVAKTGEPASSPKRAQRATGRETILIVEDDCGIRRLMQRSLADRGYRVLVAESAAHAMSLATSAPGNIDLLLSDVVMPDTNGPELAQRIVPLRPSIRVLYVSGFPNRVSLGGGLMSGRAAFLPKPFAPQALATKVRECLANRS